MIYVDYFHNLAGSFLYLQYNYHQMVCAGNKKFLHNMNIL